jgi:hypothetical protein
MLDTVIGPIINVFNNATFQMHVTHIGKHNKFRYNTNETILVVSNNTKYSLIQLKLYSLRIKCHIRYRDEYNRLCADVYLE